MRAGQPAASYDASGRQPEAESATRWERRHGGRSWERRVEARRQRGEKDQVEHDSLEEMKKKEMRV
jgi:hypothetical protein